MKTHKKDRFEKKLISFFREWDKKASYYVGMARIQCYSL